MGVINDIFTKNKITFSKIEEIIQNLLKQNKNDSKYINTLYEIGLLKEYSYIKSKKLSKEIIYVSRKNKSIKVFINSAQMNKNFVEWSKFFFDINRDDFNSEIFEKLKGKLMNKEFFRNNIKKYLFKSKSFNKLLNYGIPNNFREFIWDIAIAEKYTNRKYFNYEEEQKHYISLLKNSKSNPTIEKDLNRTFIHESEKTKRNIQKLRNILSCIYKINNEYCQGMNFISGFLLKLTNFDEVKTFYILKNILNDIKGYFEDGFPLLKKNINIFEQYFKELFPNLYKHFEKCEIYNEFWVGKWLQTLFSLSLPFEELCSIWDVLIIKGFNYIINISLALINSIEKELLELDDSSDILEYINNVIYPKETICINKKEFEEQNYFIIPLNEVLDKANELEKKIMDNYDNSFAENIKSDNSLNKFSSILKKETNNDLESFSSKDNDISIKHSSSKSSTYSSYTDNSTMLGSPNWTKAHNNVDNLKINLCNVQSGQKDINKKTTFYSSKLINNFNENNNISTYSQRGSVNVNSYNLNLNNLRNSYNINYPIQNSQYVFYPNNNMNYNIINNRPQYSNILIYYA